MKGWILIAALLLIALTVASAVHVDGEVQPVGPVLTVAIRDSEGWYARPTLTTRADDARSVYVVAPVLPEGNRFRAVRVDTQTGHQTSAEVTLDPGSSYRAFEPADARAEVRGVRFARPAFHLMSYPEGGGPGFHSVDSATGRLIVKTDGRNLMTRKVFNSSTTQELLALVSVDPNGRWLAALAQGGNGWKLFLYARNPLEKS